MSKTELAGKHRLSNIALNLENLWTTLWLSVKLKHISWIRLSFHIQVKLSRRRTLRILTNRNPTIMKHSSLGLRSRQIQRHGNPPQQPSRVHSARSPSPACVNRNFQAKLAGKERLSNEFLEICFAQVEARGYSLRLTVSELVFGRNERNVYSLKGKVLELDLAKTWRRRRMNNRASRLRSNWNLKGQIAYKEAHERTRIHRRRSHRERV